MPDTKTIEKAAEALGISIIEAEEQNRPVNGLFGCWYFWDCFRGGKSAIVSTQGDILVGNSSISYNELRNEFASGRRTNL